MAGANSGLVIFLSDVTTDTALTCPAGRSGWRWRYGAQLPWVFSLPIGLPQDTRVSTASGSGRNCRSLTLPDPPYWRAVSLSCWLASPSEGQTAGGTFAFM